MSIGTFLGGVAEEFSSYLNGYKDERLVAHGAAVGLLRATDAASAELASFFSELNEVVIAFNQRQILFGDRYFRLKFKLQPIKIPADYRLKCAQLRMYSYFFKSEGAALKLARDAEIFYDYVREHNTVALIRFLGYDNSVRKLLQTIDEVHLRQLVTLVNGGEAGGSPLGVNMLIHDFDNTGAAYLARRAEFTDLSNGLARLELKRPLTKAELAKK